MELMTLTVLNFLFIIPFEVVQQLLSYFLNCIGGVIVSMVASSALEEDRGFVPQSGQTYKKTIKIVFVASPLSMQH